MTNKYTELASGVSRSSVTPLDYIDLRNTTNSVLESTRVIDSGVSDVVLLILMGICVGIFIALAVLKFSKGSTDI